MERFENKYHPWIVSNAWKSNIACIFSSWMDLLDFCFHKIVCIKGWCHSVFDFVQFMVMHLEGYIPHPSLQFEEGDMPLRIYIKGCWKDFFMGFI
jgi:hypothetical protein